MNTLPVGPLRPQCSLHSLDPLDYQKFKSDLDVCLREGIAPSGVVDLLSEAKYYCEAMESKRFDFAS